MQADKIQSAQLRRGGVQGIERGGLQGARENPVARGGACLGGPAADQESARGFGQRRQPEVHGGHRGQRAEAANERLLRIQTGHVLHHHATTLNQAPVQCRHGQADHHVARATEKTPPRTAAVRGHDAAHRGALRARRIERQHLALGGQDGAQLMPRRAGCDADGEVARFILQNAAQPVETQIHIRGRRGAAHGVLAARAAQNNTVIGRGRVLQGLREFLRAFRPHWLHIQNKDDRAEPIISNAPAHSGHAGHAGSPTPARKPAILRVCPLHRERGPCS